MSRKLKEEAKFPSKTPLKEMDKFINGGEINKIQISSKNGTSLINQPIEANPGKFIPRVFKMPVRAVGVGISTIAKIFGIQIKIDTSRDQN